MSVSAIARCSCDEQSASRTFSIFVRQFGNVARIERFFTNLDNSVRNLHSLFNAKASSRIAFTERWNLKFFSDLQVNALPLTTRSIRMQCQEFLQRTIDSQVRGSLGTSLGVDENIVRCAGLLCLLALLSSYPTMTNYEPIQRIFKEPVYAMKSRTAITSSIHSLGCCCRVRQSGIGSSHRLASHSIGQRGGIEAIDFAMKSTRRHSRTCFGFFTFLQLLSACYI